jgi:uncharacterized phage protein (TIGR01671 family)|nr:MAG TPA: YopX protein [Caudoviricetes sp.]
MREILFRGKRIANGEWVQGYICRYGWTGKEKDYIIPDYASALYTAEIDPETIGQYTGCTDKNGNKIFEGDIVWDNYEEERGIVQWDNDTARFIITCSTFTVDFDSVCGEELEIVGNIYDNPEMMEKIEENYE